MDERTPSVETLTRIVETATSLADCVIYLHQGRPGAELPGISFVEPLLAIRDLERLLNPKRLAIGTNGRRTFIIKGWSNSFRLLQGLELLRNSLDQLLVANGLEDLAWADGYMAHNSADVPAPKPGDASILLPRSWPYSISMDTISDIGWARTWIRDVLAANVLMNGLRNGQMSLPGTGSSACGSVSIHETAEKYAVVTKTKPNPSWISKLVKNKDPRLPLAPDGRPTQEAGLLLAAQILAAKPAKRKKLEKEWKQICPACGERTYTLIGADHVCPRCFDKRQLLPEV